MSESIGIKREYLNGELSFVVVTVHTSGGYAFDCLRCGAHIQNFCSLKQHECVKDVVGSAGIGKTSDWTQYVPAGVEQHMKVFTIYCLSVYVFIYLFKYAFIYYCL